jgi:hypothetical protein
VDFGVKDAIVGGGSSDVSAIMFADQALESKPPQLVNLQKTYCISHIVSQVAKYETTSELWNNYLPIASYDSMRDVSRASSFRNGPETSGLPSFDIPTGVT